MATISEFSETNVCNSIATLLADKLIEAGYLVYWHRIDALQTGTTEWYLEYTANRETLALDPQFAAKLDAAKGVLTLKDASAAIPEYPVRPRSDGFAPAHDEIPVPNLTVECSPVTTGENVGIGERMKSRYRTAFVYGWARDRFEMGWLCDRLTEWFDPDTVLVIANHDAGGDPPPAVGAALVEAAMPEKATVLDGAEAATYEVLLSATLRFEA